MSNIYSEYAYIRNIHIISQITPKCQSKIEKKAIKNNVKDAMLKRGETSSARCPFMSKEPDKGSKLIMIKYGV